MVPGQDNVLARMPEGVGQGKLNVRFSYFPDMTEEYPWKKDGRTLGLNPEPLECEVNALITYLRELCLGALSIRAVFNENCSKRREILHFS